MQQPNEIFAVAFCTIYADDCGGSVNFLGTFSCKNWEYRHFGTAQMDLVLKFKKATEIQFSIVLNQNSIETWQIIWEGIKPTKLIRENAVYVAEELEHWPFLRTAFYKDCQPGFRERIVYYFEECKGSISHNDAEYEYLYWQQRDTFTVEQESDSLVLSAGQSLDGVINIPRHCCDNPSQPYDITVTRLSSDKIQTEGKLPMIFDIINKEGKSALYGKTESDGQIFYISLTNAGVKNCRATGEIRREMSNSLFFSTRQIVGRLVFK